MTDTLSAAEAGYNSLLLDDGGTNEKPLSDAAFEQKVEEPKAPSTREALEKALGEAEKAEEKPAENVEEKPKEEAKPEKSRSEDGKFAKAEEPKPEAADAKAEKGVAEKPATERSGQAERQSEGRKYAEPPARFLPEARAKWANVPHELKAEFHRVSEEFERDLTEHKDFRDDLKEYEDLARQHNVTIKDTMARYVNADRMLSQDFGKGVAEMSKMYGHHPNQVMAMVLRAFGGTPQQYAEHVLKNPQQHAIQQAPQPVQQPQQAPQVQALADEVSSLKSQLVWANQIQPMLDAFKAQHDDFDQHWPRMQEVLASKVLEQLYGNGLKPEQKLAEAYRIAGGITSPSRSEPEPVPAHSEANDGPSRGAGDTPSPDAGTKSIRGAPTSGADPAKKRFKNNRDAATAALAEIGV